MMAKGQAQSVNQEYIHHRQNMSSQPQTVKDTMQVNSMNSSQNKQQLMMQT